MHAIALLKILPKLPSPERTDPLNRACQGCGSSLNSFLATPLHPLHKAGAVLNYLVSCTGLPSFPFRILFQFFLFKKSGYLLFSLWYQKRYISSRKIFPNLGKTMVTSPGALLTLYFNFLSVVLFQDTTAA